MTLNLSDILNKVLNESVGSNEVVSVINNHNYVDINYVDEEGHAVGRRLIQPYAYGLSMAGNEVLRAFQMEGDSYRGQPHWKTFRLDRITSWHPRKQTFNMPPPMQGYNTEDYNENGDGSMSKVYVQAKFGNSLDDTLAFVKAQRDFVKNAPKVNSKNTQGPIPFANQQRKKNVFTSQPNSKKYAQYAKNIQDTENEIDRFNDDVWTKAEAEKQQQNDAMLQNSVKKPQQMQQGPINTKTNDDKEKNKQ
jgi:hypothetical protein